MKEFDHNQARWALARRRRRALPRIKKHKLVRVAHVVARPVTLLVHVTHKRHSKGVKATVETTIGVCLMATGSTLALNAHTWCPAIVPHTVWDMVAYALHGFGAAPIIKTIAEKLKIRV